MYPCPNKYCLKNDKTFSLLASAPPTPVQENHVSEHNTPPAEEAVAGEVYNPPENGDVPVVEEVPVAEVVDEVEDDTQMVVESNAKIEELPKKSYASIVSRKSGALGLFFCLIVLWLSYLSSEWTPYA